jgi:hypothetical protein
LIGGIRQIGYARVSTLDQKPALQIDALRSAGCERIFTEKASGAQRDRPELKAALEYLRYEGTLVWKLDRLARSMRQLIETVEGLQSRGIELCSPTESINTATPGGRLVFHIFGALAEFEHALLLLTADRNVIAVDDDAEPDKVTEMLTYLVDWLYRKACEPLAALVSRYDLQYLDDHELAELAQRVRRRAACARPSRAVITTSRRWTAPLS